MVHNQVVIHHQAQLSHLQDMDHRRQTNKAIHLQMPHNRISHQVVNNNNQDNTAVLVHNQIISSLRPKRHLKTHTLLDNLEVILLLPHRHMRTMSHRKITHHLRQLVRLNLHNLGRSKTRVRSPIMLANQVQVLARRSTVPPLHLRHLAPPLRAAILMPKAVSQQAHHLPRRRHIRRIAVRHQHRKAEAMHPRCHQHLLDIPFIKHHIRHRIPRIHHHRTLSHHINHRTLRINHLTNQLISHPINHHINHRTSHRNNLSNSRKQLRRRNSNRLRVQLRVDFNLHLVHHKVLLHHQALNNNLPMGRLLRKHMFHRLQEDNHRYCWSNMTILI